MGKGEKMNTWRDSKNSKELIAIYKTIEALQKIKPEQLKMNVKQSVVSPVIAWWQTGGLTA